MITPLTDQAHQRYHWKGKRVPGGSTIAKQCQDCECLMEFAEEQALLGKDYRLVAKKQGAIGEIAHALFQSFVMGEGIDLSNCSAKDIALARQACDKAISFWNRNNFEYVACEVQLSCDLGYGGTLDLVARRVETKGLVLLDWKRSNGIYYNHLIQVCGYEELWNRNHPDDLITERHVIRLGKEGPADFSERKVEDFEARILKDTFLANLAVYKLRKQWEKAHK